MIKTDEHLRYVESFRIHPTGDTIVDVASPLSALISKEYFVEVLCDRHGLRETDGEDRASQAIPYVAVALEYIAQARSGPAEVAFLPGCYAIWNLMKVYALLGTRHSELSSNRRHGVTYDVTTKANKSILDEVVGIRLSGAFRLFYESIVGRPLGARQMALRDVHPYLADVASEYYLSIGDPVRMCTVEFLWRETGDEVTPCIRLHEIGRREPITRTDLMLLHGVWKAVGKGYEDVIEGPPTIRDKATAKDEMVRKYVHPELLYHPQKGSVVIPLAAGPPLLPEELPIALTFYHMSMIVRYKPDHINRRNNLNTGQSSIRHRGDAF